MIKRMILIWMLCMAYSFTFSQSVASFYEEFNDAKFAFVVNKDTNALLNFYDRAIDEYPNLIPSIGFLPVDAIVNSESYGNHKLANKILAYYVNRGLSIDKLNMYIQYSRNKDIIQSYLNTPKAKDILTRMKMKPHHEKSEVAVYSYFFMEQLNQRDQELRLIVDENDTSKNTAKILWKMDSINFVELYMFTEKYGLPKYSILDNTDYYKIVLFHLFKYCGSKEFTLPNGELARDYFATRLKDAVLRGNFPNSDFAVLIDRPFGFTCGLPLTYGETYSMFGVIAGQLKEISQVDHLRSEIFLCTLGDLSKMYGFELPEEYKPD